MKKLAAALVVALLGFVAAAHAEDRVVYEPKVGPGKGKHIVLLSGDEEYRSEEGLPQLGKILSQRHGFKCTVLFAVDTNGVIDPNTQKSLSHPEALDSADLIIMSLRYRNWPDETMKHFAGAYQRGVPIIGLRTSTHAFNGIKGRYENFNNFGKQVLGEKWVSHWGVHKKEATRGIIEPSAKNDPIMRGVEDIFGDTDVYEAAPPADARILVRGQVLKGMKATDEPADYKKKRASGSVYSVNAVRYADILEQGVNDPMMPIAWTREHKNEAGKVNKVVCTTMGSATDLENEGLRRLVVNGVYWGLGMEIPAKMNVALVGEYKPTNYGFNGFKKGTKPGDYELK